MLTMPAVPGETLVDYFMRVLDRVRQTGEPLACEHRDRAFVARHDMTTGELVRAWHDGAGVLANGRDAVRYHDERDS
jgi:hypothetical protein